MRRVRRLARESAGQSIVELALALPIIVFGLLGGVDLSRAFAVQLAIQNAARAAAEGALLRGEVDKELLAGYAAAELEGAPGVSATGATVVISKETTEGVCYITVRVYHTFRTLVPWPLVPNVARIDRTVQVRDLAANSPTGGGGGGGGSGGSGGSGHGSGSGGSGESGDPGEDSGEDSDDSNEGGGGDDDENDTDCDNSADSGEDPSDDGSGEGTAESGDSED